RCVRGAQLCFGNFTNNSNGTVTDSSTGLMWQQKPLGSSITLNNALSYCGGLSLGGYSDWRLPNIKELASIIDYMSVAASNTTFFLNGLGFWSSTTAISYSPAWAWGVYSFGVIGIDDKQNGDTVQCVRGGQPGSLGNLTLSVSTIGTGSGTVTSSPSGISCGSTCAASYSSGTRVTLTASPASGSTFAGWSGGGCSGTGTCSVTMYVATSVTATFRSTSISDLPDTGQTTCYDANGNVIACAGSGQDGAYIINPMSYTDNGNGTVTINVTGLMWQKQDDGLYNWYQASGTYDATNNPTSQNVCGVLSLGGYSDWRLPTVTELMSIVNYGVPSPGPTINATYFPNTNEANYWSSTMVSYNMGYAWIVGFSSGSVDVGDTSGSGYVRCVRGVQLYGGNFTNNSNGTVTDSSTGLMWQQTDVYSMAWDNALSYCDGLSLGGYSGWRLPNIKELTSIVDYALYNQVINTTFFLNAIASNYWSSTTYAGSTSDAWAVHFSNGYVGWDTKSNGDTVRCVNSG